MFDRYSLVLTVTRNCNMRCSYCYAGQKTGEVMPEATAQKAIDRAIASIRLGGVLDLGFFGGEPLMEAALIERLIGYARVQALAAGLGVSFGLTTNGTITHARAWSVMTQPDVHLAISFDGLPKVHDLHRRFRNGEGTAGHVAVTVRRLLAAGKDFRVVMVVRPDTVDLLPEGIEFLQSLGVRRVDPSLDVWAEWTDGDVARLEYVVKECAEIWRRGLPFFSIGWFDEKLAGLARLPKGRPRRCGFGRGEVTVTPSGRLYPCERLAGEDRPDDPMALPGTAVQGEDFLDLDEPASDRPEGCGECAAAAMCNTFCRCSNYIRTGDINRPDRLLCAWNQACLCETARIMNETMLPRPVGHREEVRHEFATA